MKKRRTNKKVPRLRTDEQAEAFLAQDLSNLDFSQFKPEKFVFVVGEVLGKKRLRLLIGS